MEATIEEGFKDFLAKITSPLDRSEVAEKHRAFIESCLKQALDIQDFFLGGSYANDTSVSGYSHVDYFARMPPEKRSANSGFIVSKVRDVLTERFPHARVQVSCPPINISVPPAEEIAIIPVHFAQTIEGHVVYYVPDCSADWTLWSPEAHKAYLHQVDQKHDGKVKELIRLIKAWKYYQGIDISSYYLELVTAKYAERRSSLDYGKDTRGILDWLNKSRLHMIWDPTGISGRIFPSANITQWETAKKKFPKAAWYVTNAIGAWETAKKKFPKAAWYATKAIDAEAKGNVQAAFEYWDLLFNHQFLPSK